MGKFPTITTLQITAEIQNMLTEIKRESEQFQGRIVFVTLFNDTVSRENGNKELWIANFLNLAEYARSFTHGHWSFLWPQLFPSISSVSTEQQRTCVKSQLGKSPNVQRVHGETRSTERFGDHGNANRIVVNKSNLFDR